MNSKFLLAVFILIAIAGVGAVLYTQQQAMKNESEAGDTWKKLIPDNAATTTEENATSTPEIASFEQCVAAGKEVVGEKPNRKCIVSLDLAYIEIMTCTAPTGEFLSIYEAQRLFDSGPCSIEGSAKGEFICNDGTGTWWVDIQAYREGCNPACVIDVVTKKAEVNWRCTGALVPK
ncbi:MAG: hypothetical protein MUD10_03055 [Candidatus Pacebacteria bacterium]|jgi:hypothetical protein|nr:hypothetical protein [Candidatus Paceibacterota bacterium]